MDSLAPPWKIIDLWFDKSNTSTTYHEEIHHHHYPIDQEPKPKFNWTKIIGYTLSFIGVIWSSSLTLEWYKDHRLPPSSGTIILDGTYLGNIEFKNDRATYPIQNGLYRLKISNEAGKYRWQITNTTTLKTYDLGKSDDVIHQDDFEVPTIGNGIIEARGRSMIIKSNPKNNPLYDFYFRK